MMEMGTSLVNTGCPIRRPDSTAAVLSPAETPTLKSVSDLGYVWYIRIERTFYGVFTWIFIKGVLGLSVCHHGLDYCHLGPIRSPRHIVYLAWYLPKHERVMI
jgi:hypothetical protein